LTDPPTLHSKDGEPTRHHDGHLVAVRHYLEPEWQSRHKSLAYAIAVSPRPSRQQSVREPQRRPSPPRVSPHQPAASVNPAPSLTQPDGPEVHQRKHGYEQQPG
jgi:hypothetical protein